MANGERLNFAGQKLGPREMNKAVLAMLGLVEKADGTPSTPPKKVWIGAISKPDCE